MAPSETPLFIESPAGPIFAIESAPDGEERRAVVVNGGGWLSTSTNRNAVLVRLARKLAHDGHRVARFDWRGTGESGGSLDRFDLASPFTDDVGAVVRHLETTGSPAIAMTGICFGSVSALAAADRYPSVDRLALISLPFPSHISKTDHKTDRIELDSVLKMATKPATWSTLLKNPAMRSAVIRGVKRKILRSSSKGRSTPGRSTGLDTAALIDRLVERGVDIRLIFGERDLEYASYLAHIESDPLPDGVEVTVVPGDLANFGTVDAQAAAIEHVAAAIAR